MTLRDLFTGNILETDLSDLAPIADMVLAAVLGSIAVYVALQQWRTHQRRVDAEQRDRCQQRQYDLFDRRWKIYAGVRDVLHGMSTSRTGSRAGLKAAEIAASDESVLVLTLELAHQDLLSLMTKAHFLFGPDVNEYLEELNTHCRKLLEIERKQETTAGARLPEAWCDELKWFDEQETTAKQRFEGYLRLTH